MKLGNVINRLEADSFLQPETFYCQECDSGENKVVSNDPTTGHFYIVWGHPFQGKMVVKPNTSQVSGDYHPIIFAVCTRCLQESQFESVFDF
jgi:hypothetical protein